MYRSQAASWPCSNQSFPQWSWRRLPMGSACNLLFTDNYGGSSRCPLQATIKTLNPKRCIEKTLSQCRAGAPN